MTVPNKPEVGETNWGTKLNTALDWLDTRISTVELTPGPVGLTGPAGAPGVNGVDGLDAPTPTDSSFVVVGGAVGSAPTFNGEPLFSGSHVVTGELVHFQVQVDFSNITGFGTGQYYIDLPFASKYAYQFAAGCLHDASTGTDYPIFGHVVAGANRMYLKSIDSSGNASYNVSFTSIAPVSLAVEDSFHISGTYIRDTVVV